MQKVGVEAVVAGLSSFLGDMKKVDGAISGLIPGTKLLDNAFSFLGNTVEGFVNFTLNALAHALGELIADAIEFVIQKIGEFISGTIELSNELARLEVRLVSLNMPKNAEDVEDWDAAMQSATEATKEQLEWLQKLAVAAPFAPEQIADIYTASRYLGLADEEARNLTTDILEFAAGSGLGNEEAERLIINLRQMAQRGKVTGKELNDLARGAMLPLEDIFARMADNMGVSNAELQKLISSAEGVDPDLFLAAFQEMVNEEPRFIGAMGRLGRTFEFATKNFQEFLANLGASGIVKNLLGLLGERIASITDQFVMFNEQGELIHTKKWERILQAVKDIGSALYALLDTFLDLLPSAESVADGMIAGLEGIADWLNEHRDDITNWIIEASRWINNILIPDIKRVLKWLFGSEDEEGAIQKFGEWIWEVFIPAIQAAAKWGEEVLIPFLKNDLLPIFITLVPLAEAIGDVLITAFGGEPDQEFTDWIHDELIPGIEDFTDWITENKDEIALWVGRLVIATIHLAIFAGIVSLAIGFIGTLVAMFINWLATLNPIATVLAIIAVLVLVAFGVPVLAAILLIVAAVKIAELVIRLFIGTLDVLKENLSEGWAKMRENFEQTLNEMMTAAKNGDWVGVGRAFIEGILRGFNEYKQYLIDAAHDIAANVVESFKETFVLDFDLSNLNFSGAGGGVGTSGNILPGTATGSQSVNTRNTQNNYNLTVNSNANNENVVQDFNLLQSLGGR